MVADIRVLSNVCREKADHWQHKLIGTTTRFVWFEFVRKTKLSGLGGLYFRKAHWCLQNSLNVKRHCFKLISSIMEKRQLAFSFSLKSTRDVAMLTISLCVPKNRLPLLLCPTSVRATVECRIARPKDVTCNVLAYYIVLPILRAHSTYL